MLGIGDTQIYDTLLGQGGHRPVGQVAAAITLAQGGTGKRSDEHVVGGRAEEAPWPQGRPLGGKGPQLAPGTRQSKGGEPPTEHTLVSHFLTMGVLPPPPPPRTLTETQLSWRSRNIVKGSQVHSETSNVSVCADLQRGTVFLYLKVELFPFNPFQLGLGLKKRKKSKKAKTA